MMKPDLSLPKQIKILFSSKSTLNKKDAAKLQRKLGITAKEIASSCYLAPTGVLTTTKKPYVIESNMAAEAIVPYDGNITGYSLRALALCILNKPLPTNAGVVVKLNDRYSVPLSTIKCEAPTTSKPKELSITYDGTRSSNCEHYY
ncbi:MAG: hypothetical protein PHE27_06125 [Alphaproteobacteria bacterium]|nr:hypothetical protein [Alphaproteobacteria bacterium]